MAFKKVYDLATRSKTGRRSANQFETT